MTCPIQGNFHTITDLLLASPQDIAKRCKLSPVEVKKTLEKLLDAVPLIDLDRLDTFPADEIFTTGDQILDKAIGGGIRTGMIWEVVGERYFFELSLYCLFTLLSVLQERRSSPFNSPYTFKHLLFLEVYQVLHVI